MPFSNRRLWLCVSLALMSNVAVLSQDAKTTIDSIREGQIEVDITQPKPATFNARVRVSYQITHSGNAPDESLRFFPVSAPPLLFQQQFRVHVNGNPVEFEKLPLVGSPSEFLADTKGLDPSQCKPRIDKWIREDAKLNEMVVRARRLLDRQDEIRAAHQQFDERIKQQLIDDELAYVALNVAKGQGDLGDLVRLMPEVDASLRIDEPYQRWPYISILDDSKSNRYRPYEEQWRAEANTWLTSTPELKQLVPELQELWQGLRDGHELLDGPVVKYLQNERGLSRPDSEQFKRYLEGHSNPFLAITVARFLFPDLKEISYAKMLEAERRLTDWGFDRNVLSVFSGRLIPRDSESRLSMPGGWRDRSVLQLVGRPAPSVASVVHRDRFEPIPTLLKFSAGPIADQPADVVIEYNVALQPQNVFSSVTFTNAMSDLAVVFPGEQTIPVIVTTPAKTHFVISPAPTTVETGENGEHVFRTTLKRGATALHVAPVQQLDQLMGRIQYDSETEADFEILINRTDNLTVRPLQLGTLFMILLNQKQFWKAHELSLQIKAEHPEFLDYFEVAMDENYAAREASKLVDWLQDKGRSPIFETDEDIQQIETLSEQPSRTAAIQALANRVAKLDVAKLTAKQQLGRQFVLCQASGDEADVKAFVQLARQHGGETSYSLQLIELLTIDKSAALPFVLALLDPNFRAKKDPTQEMRRQRNAAYSALRSFRSQETADPIIEFMRSTNDSLLIQGAMDALSDTTLPERFDALASLADRVLESSESAYLQYVNLLVRSDRGKAIPLLIDLQQRHPEMSPRIMQVLGQADYRMALPQAIAIYHNSKDIEGELRSAISTIHDLAEPKDIASLTYRSGLEPWMNESLVSVIRMKGGDESVFPFVEAYYREFVQGKKRHNHLTCVAAFERIGDVRALPYLKDILANTQRKRDAATAIGNLLLDRCIIDE